MKPALTIKPIPRLFHSTHLLHSALLLLSSATIAGTGVAQTTGTQAMSKIEHVVVIYAENHSFDNLYGKFPGANGIDKATAEQKLQLDHDGQALKTLKVFDRHGNPDPTFPELPNGPFQIDAPPSNKKLTDLTPSGVHAFFHNKEQINGGKNNLFAAMSNAGGWVMGYYSGEGMKLWQWAKDYTLADNFFMGAYGGSYLNHLWLVCACTPKHLNAPKDMDIQLDTQGKLLKMPGSPSANVGAVKVFSGGGVQIDPEGNSVNTTQPPFQPSAIPPSPKGLRTLADPEGIRWGGKLQVALPPQTLPTIGDRLNDKGVSWAWYAGGFHQALADGMQEPSAERKVIYSKANGAPNFQPHHQPFNYFANYAPGTSARAKHMKDGEDFLSDIEKGTLPAVSFYKPVGMQTQHPSYTDVQSGDSHIDSVLHKLKASAQWKNMLVVVTYDENGGYWDHVPPPTGPGFSDAFGPGTRVPALLIGPSVKKGFIDSNVYDTTSILKFVTERFKLDPLPGVRKGMGNLTHALQ